MKIDWELIRRHTGGGMRAAGAITAMIISITGIAYSVLGKPAPQIDYEELKYWVGLGLLAFTSWYGGVRGDTKTEDKLKEQMEAMLAAHERKTGVPWSPSDVRTVADAFPTPRPPERRTVAGILQRHNDEEAAARATKKP